MSQTDDSVVDVELDDETLAEIEDAAEPGESLEEFVIAACRERLHTADER